MKIKLFLISVIILLLSYPILGKSNFSVTLNNMNYDTKHPILLKGNEPYLSIYDLANLISSPLDVSSGYTLLINNKPLRITPAQYDIRFGNATIRLNHMPFLKGNTLYVPISLLDTLEYPYVWSNNILALNSSIPYSQNTDPYESHIFVDALWNFNNIPKHVTNFSSTLFVNQMLEASMVSKDYLAFMDTTHKTDVYSLLSENLKSSPYNSIEVAFRVLTHPNGVPSVSSYKVFPVNLEVTKDGLQVTVNNETITYSGIWATYIPSYSKTKIDLNKTIDTTIMRVLYQYYRDTYGLKDDKFFSPLYTLSSSRTTTLTQKAYYTSTTHQGKDTITHNCEYELKLYRVHTTGKLTFVVDILKLN